jgi:pyruvate kinase
VTTLATIALRAEASLHEYGYLQKIKPSPANVVTQAIGQASVGMSATLKAAAIISLTESGFTSRLISKYRPNCPILAITSSKRVVRKLSMNWGVMPILYQGKPEDDKRIEFAISETRKMVNANSGDILIITAGHLQLSGGTDLIRIITL